MNQSVRTRLSMVVALTAIAILGSVFASSAGAAATISRGAAVTLNATAGDLDVINVSANVFGYVISDSAGATAGTNCTQGNSTTVTCLTTITGQVTLNLGDQLDSVAVDGSLPATTRVTVDGEAGGTSVDAPTAVNPIVVSTSMGTVTTGLASDTLNISGTYRGSVSSGPGDDHLNLTNSMPAGFDQARGCRYGYSGALDCPIDLHTGEGDDHVEAGTSTGPFYYTAESGDDILIGGSGNDGFAQNGDTVSDGDDWMMGNGGDDRFIAYGPAASSSDHLFGGAGDDELISELSTIESTMFDGGPGVDKLRPLNVSTTLTISLDGMMDDGVVGDAMHNIMGNVETIDPTGDTFGSVGMQGDDTLTGNADANRLRGFPGNDTITGLAGADTLIGDGGNDTIYAKDGDADVVSCGAGTDTAYVDTGLDTVTSCESQF